MAYNCIYNLRMENEILTAFLQGVVFEDGRKKDIGEDVVGINYQIVDTKIIRCAAGFKNVILKGTSAEYYDYPPDRVKNSGSVDDVKHVQLYIDLKHLKLFLPEFNVYFWICQQMPRECDLEIDRPIENGLLAKELTTSNYTSIFEVKSFGEPIKGYEGIWKECKKFQNIIAQ